MAEFGVEEVFEAPVLTVAQAEKIGRVVLEELQPEALLIPQRINVSRWVNVLLPRMGIWLYPAKPGRLPPNIEALTVPKSDGRIFIYMTPELEAALLFGHGRKARRALCTFLHELVHAVLHIPRFVQLIATGQLGLPRRSDQMPLSRNPEWQAFCVAGCIAMPRAMLMGLRNLSLDRISQTFGVSKSFAAAHLKRLGLFEKEAA